MTKQKLHYCLTCGRIVSLFPGTVEWHFGDFSDEEKLGPAQCYGPFTNSTPPELPFSWPYHLEEPSLDELKMMNENAEALWFDLELGKL